MDSYKFGRCAICLGILGLSVCALAAAAAGGYHLLKRIPLGAAEGGGEYFDYITIDPVARRVYLSHGTEIKVVDADNFSVLGTLTGFKRNHVRSSRARPWSGLRKRWRPGRGDHL